MYTYAYLSTSNYMASEHSKFFFKKKEKLINIIISLSSPAAFCEH